MTASTRRAALGAILAAPLTGGAVMALPSVPDMRHNLPNDEAQFLALAPRLLPLLDEFDRIWATVVPLYSAWSAARGRGLWTPEHERLPEWHAYEEARWPADEIDTVVEALYEPYKDLRLTSFEAIKLRHRVGLSFDSVREDLLDDLDALWGRKPCAY